MSEQRSTILTVVLGVVAGLLIALVVFIAVQALGGDDEAATTTTLAPATSEATTTTRGHHDHEATTTTTLPETPTTEATTTTSSTSTTESATTTVTLAPLELEPGGIGAVDFGAAPDTAIAYTTTFLGPPLRDTGWVDSFSEFGTCPPPEVRGVQWGTSPNGFSHAFTLLFTKAATSHLPAGGEHLFGYDYYGGDVDLSTPEGMTVGSTLLEGQTLYPTMEINESPWDPATGVWVVDDNPSDDAQLFGYATGQIRRRSGDEHPRRRDLRRVGVGPALPLPHEVGEGARALARAGGGGLGADTTKMRPAAGSRLPPPLRSGLAAGARASPTAWWRRRRVTQLIATPPSPSTILPMTVASWS